MNIKNILMPKKIILSFILSFICLVLIFYLAGLRFNFTPSLPSGLYQISKEKPEIGDYVSFCLSPENNYSKLAKDRNYLGRGTCPNGLKALLKIYTATDGDFLEVSSEGIKKNGYLLAETRRLNSDGQGHKLPPTLLKDGFIPYDKALVLSQKHKGSFDSRHFGLVPLKSLKKVKPILIFK